MVELQLWNSSTPALVDDEFSHFTKWRWRLNAQGYVVRYGERCIRLHHAVFGKPPKGSAIDHINLDKLDNRSANLRLVSMAQNAQNRSVHRNNKTGYRGVFFRKDTGRYLAHCTVGGVVHRLGYFDTPEQAGVVAKAFRKKNMPFSTR